MSVYFIYTLRDDVEIVGETRSRVKNEDIALEATVLLDCLLLVGADIYFDTTGACKHHVLDNYQELHLIYFGI